MSHALGNNYGKEYSFLNKPVWVTAEFTVTPTNGLGVTNLRGSGIKNVFMHTTTTPASNQGYLNPNPASGYAVIQLNYNYARYVGGFYGAASPLSGTNLAINATALTVGNPYVISSVGTSAAGTVTIAPVADVAGSLASTWFRIYDSYGNTFIIWFSVSGVGSAPVGVSGTLVQQTIAANSSAATIGAALVVTLNGLLAAQPGNLTAPSGVASFTASGTTTVTVVSTQTNPSGALPGTPADGSIPTGFTFATTVKDSVTADWYAVGLEKGVVPKVGAAFIATATGSGSSSGQVQAPTVSGIDWIEVIGDPNATIAPQPYGGSPNTGGYVLVQFLASASSSITTLTPTAPAAGSLIRLGFYVEFSSVLISGE